jgi:hypothetical protein
MNYTYKEMLDKAKTDGVANEKTMWNSVESLSKMLCIMKKEHPDMYWEFMREQHGIMYSNHYDKDFAEYDVSLIKFTNKKGEEATGAYWTVEQIEQATSNMRFPQGTTKWDKYVAFNAAYSDFSKKFEDTDVLNIGFLFYFADEDWGSTTKVWEYMQCKNKK